MIAPSSKPPKVLTRYKYRTNEKVYIEGGHVGGRWIDKDEFEKSVILKAKLRIKPSTIPEAGVGVFAMTRIAQGEVVAVTTNWPVATFHEDSIAAMDLTPSQREFIDSMTSYGSEHRVVDFYTGDFHQLDITHYLNEPRNGDVWFEPNVTHEGCLVRNICAIVALRDIEEGEELFISYESGFGGE